MPTVTTDYPRVAIVTGGSGGIGGVTAQRLARDGMAIVVAYAGQKAPAEDVVTAIVEAGGTATSCQADVAEESDVAALFHAAELSYGGVDVVVNAAGIMLLSPLVDLDLEVFDRMVRINLRGTFVVVREAARRVRPGGAIINFSSSVQKIARPSYSAYAATKGAVDAITLIVAKEMRGRDVTVNSVAPGPTATPLFLEGKDQETLDRMRSEPPLERLGTPADVAEVVAFLAGPARWVNGQIIYPNGGVV
jgi:3-oxoacyl-[acyl-carrier protein] reductase